MVGANRVRIIGGQWRRRWLAFPPAPGLRPTPDRVRETVFNWLGQDLGGHNCLDLFAGSGAFGIESLSRGAAHVTLVERHPAVAAALRANIDALGGRENAAVQQIDVLEFLRLRNERRGLLFDVVYCDPPFGSGLLEAVLPLLPALLASGAYVYLEGERLPDLTAQWSTWREGHAGQVRFQLIQRHDD